MPAAHLGTFTSNISRARSIVTSGQSLTSFSSGSVDVSDIYRAAHVQAVAALDAYVHGVVLTRATEIAFGRLIVTVPAASRSKVGINFSAMGQVHTALTQIDAESLARAHIAGRLALETFQQPDDIAAALASVGVPRIWSTAFPSGSDTITSALRITVRRRNQIVHQCDANPLTPGNATPLSDQDALDAIDVVETVVTALDPHC